MNILIAGQGAFGTALGQILTDNGHSVTFYDPQGGVSTPPEAFHTTEVIVIAVPSAHLQYLLSDTLWPNYAGQPIILTTKGVLDPQTIFGDQIEQIIAISGPGFAEDLNNHLPTTLTTTGQLAIDLFTTSYLNLELTSDIRGVLACGALRTVYAIGAGLRRLEPNTDDLHEYIVSSLAEIKDLLPAFGGDPATADLQCGIGDLTLTCSSTKSRNYTYGLSLATDTQQPEETVEGLSVLTSIPEYIPLPPILADIRSRIPQ